MVSVFYLAASITAMSVCHEFTATLIVPSAQRSKINVVSRTSPLPVAA